ncbi:MAG: ATP-binding protein [Ktedonobacteraceae bacterium]
MSKLQESELKHIIAGGESTTAELKVAPPRPGELAERLCGMANGQGGLLIVGVEDNPLKIVGVQDTRVAIDVLLRATRHIQPVLFLNPPEPEVYLLDDQPVVVASVLPNDGPLYQSGGVCWIRRGTHTVPLSVPEMLEAANDRGLVSWGLQPARKATMNDINLERVKAYLYQRSNRSSRTGRFEDLERVLLGLDCAVVTNGGRVLPTNAGILFFGYDPQHHIPQSEIVCVLFRDELGVGGYVDRKIVTGNLQELIDETESFLSKYIAVGARIEGWKRIDLPEYPIEALREAVVNAVIHRDYSREGESIRIFYYTDRIEIHSPGLLLPGITVDMMARGEVMSKLRNPTLANLLRDVPGYMERIGSGIRLMLHEMRKIGLSDPQFREMSEFIVTFPGVPISDASTSESTQSDRNEQEAIDTGDDSLSQRIARRVEIVMRYVQDYGSITNRQYRDIAGVSENTALRDLEKLVEQGSLKRVGKRRGSQYRLP